MNIGTAARALGFAGLGLGVAEIVAPTWINKQLGTNSPNLTRVMGAREIAASIGILGRKDPTAGVLARVAGDALDIALLGFAAVGSRKRNVVFGVLAGIVAITVVDALVAAKHVQARRDQDEVLPTD